MERYYNELLKFIIENDDWKEKLSLEPYCINVKQCPYVKEDGSLKYPNLYMFSYTLVDIGYGHSDFFNPIVKACRGCIVDVDTNTMVSTPFYKFGNYGESYADEINWKNSSVQEKIDGSLIKRFYYDNQWFWVTNNGWDTNVKLPTGIISSFEEKETDNCHTFQDLIDYSWKMYKDVELNKNYTYMFELISPKNRVICDYAKTELCLLGARNIQTYEELNPDGVKRMHNDGKLSSMRSPEIYNLNTIDEVIDLCNSYKDSFHEGVVVCDNDFHRIKIKCEHYLTMKGFKGEIGFTNKKVLEAMRSGSIDDVVAAFPEVIKQTENISSMIKELSILLTVVKNFAIDVYSALMADNIRDKRKEYAKFVMNNYSEIKSIMFNSIKDGYSVDDEINSYSYEDICEKLELLENNFKKLERI